MNRGGHDDGSKGTVLEWPGVAAGGYPERELGVGKKERVEIET
jgi:hypothetical protein